MHQVGHLLKSHTRMHGQQNKKYIHTYTHTHIYTYIYIYVHGSVCVCVCVCVCIYIYITFVDLYPWRNRTGNFLPYYQGLCDVLLSTCHYDNFTVVIIVVWEPTERTQRKCCMSICHYVIPAICFV